MSGPTEPIKEMLGRYLRPWRAKPVLSQAVTSVDIKQAGLESPTTGAFYLRYKSIIQPGASAPVVKRIQNMASLPEFYRLNHIRQLANTHLAVDLEGSHNRLSHCLGTLDVAAYFLDSIQQNLSSRGEPPLSQVQLKATLVYAFVHDCFHGPMGHTLDIIRDVLWGTRAGERVDKHLLKIYVAAKSGFLWEAVKIHVAKDEEQCKEIFLLLYRFLSSSAGLNEVAFLAEIVDGEVDADRIDYIWRDHLHLEMKGFERTAEEIRQLVSSVRHIDEAGSTLVHGVRTGDVVEKPKKKTVHLRFGREHAEVVRSLLEKRVEFYRKYYEHPVKLIADEMLVHTIYYALRDANAFGAPGPALPWADDFAFLTDDGLLAFLNELTSRPGLEIPRLLLHDYRANRNFVVIYRRALSRNRFQDLVRRDEVIKERLREFFSKHWDEVVQAASAPAQSLATDPEYLSLVRRLEEIVTQPAFVDKDGTIITGRSPAVDDRELKYTEENDVLRLQDLYGGGFVKRSRLEELLWSELCKRSKFEKRLADLSDSIAISTGSTASNILSQLRQTPLIFISVSWIPTLRPQDLAAHARGLRPTEVRFHLDGKPVPYRLDLRVATEEEDYPLVLCAPGWLADPETQAAISADFSAILRERRWLLPDLL